MNDNSWSNLNNKIYYENADYDTYYDFTVKAGLNDHSDMKAINSYLEKADSILELGALFGRVIDYLLEIKFPGKITAIERSDKYFDILLKKYSSNIELLHDDIATFQYNGNFDLILWMWSGIADFNREEHFEIISKLINLLNPSGSLVIDNVHHQAKPVNVTQSDNKHYQLELPNGVIWNGYLVTPTELEEYSKLLEVDYSYKPYTTSTNRQREFSILTK